MWWVHIRQLNIYSPQHTQYKLCPCIMQYVKMCNITEMDGSMFLSACECARSCRDVPLK